MIKLQPSTVGGVVPPSTADCEYAAIGERGVIGIGGVRPVIKFDWDRPGDVESRRVRVCLGLRLAEGAAGGAR